MYFAATVPGTWVMTARTSGSSCLCAAVAAARSPALTASTIARYGVGRDVRGDADETGRADREVRQHVRVVAGEVDQVGLVEHAADLG